MIETRDPRARRREAKREQILDAAWVLAHRDGLGGISLRELAAMVDLRQPSLYAYFASKHDLYDAMFAEGNRQLLDRARPFLPTTTRAVASSTWLGCCSTSSPKTACATS